MKVLTEEQFLAQNNASRQSFGDCALHKNKGNNSDKMWSKLVDAQAEKDQKLYELRNALREKYAELVAAGQLRPPTRIERLISTANGDPVNESVQAARRILTKNNIDWTI